MPWARHYLVFVASVYFAASPNELVASDLAYGGRTKFEIFGMMDEYGMSCSPFDGETIQRFGANETTVASRFKELLQAYCKEEGVSLGFVAEEEPGGGVRFISPAIARSIWSHYEKRGIGAGDLKKSEFEDASNLDLLRYLRGVYFRNNYHHSEVICAANAAWETHHAGAILAKMGCRGVRLYTTECIPNGFVLIFSPTSEISEFLGITNSVMFDDLDKRCGNRLKLREQFGKD